MKPTITGQYIHEIILDLCQNPILQTAVINKIREFTGNSINYFSETLQKIPRFQEILSTFKKFITKYLPTIRHNLNHAAIINLSIDNDKYNPVIVEAKRIHMQYGKAAVWVENINVDSRSMLCASIVGQDSVIKYGLDGYLALLIICINDKELFFEPESLHIKCIKKLAYVLNNVPHKISFKPSRKCLEIWLKFLQTFPNFNIFTDHMEYIDEDIQIAFLKSTSGPNNCCYYYKNYKKTHILAPYIKGFLTANNKFSWIILLHFVLQLTDAQIEKIANILNYDFSRIIFGQEQERNIKSFRLQVKKREFYEILNGSKYLINFSEFSIDGSEIHNEVVYNKELKIVNIKEIYKYGFGSLCKN